MTKGRRAGGIPKGKGISRITKKKTKNSSGPISSLSSKRSVLFFLVPVLFALIAIQQQNGAPDAQHETKQESDDVSASLNDVTALKNTFPSVLVHGDEAPLIAAALAEGASGIELGVIKAELPVVEVAPFKEPLQLLDTQSFTYVINRSTDALTLVGFFDPWSESFQVTRGGFEAAAAELQEGGVGLSDDDGVDVAIAMVNTVVDTYLQCVLSPETTESWQEDDRDDNPRSNSNGFIFGRTNYYPMVTKLFKGGEFVDEYTGVLRGELILSFLRMHTAPYVTFLNNALAAEEFLTAGDPCALACFPDGLKVDSQSACALERESFNNLTEFKHGWVKYGVITGGAEACRSVMESFLPCGVLVSASGDGTTRSTFAAAAPVPFASDGGSSYYVANHIHTVKYQKDLIGFIKLNRDPFMIELTPDNSWEIIESHDFVIVALVNLKDSAQLKGVVDVIQTVTEKYPKLVKGDKTVKYSYASGVNFASQFGIRMEELPNVICYDTQNDNVVAYHNLRSKHLMLKYASKEESSKYMEEWLLEHLADGEDKSSKNEERVEVDTANAAVGQFHNERKMVKQKATLEQVPLSSKENSVKASKTTSDAVAVDLKKAGDDDDGDEDEDEDEEKNEIEGEGGNEEEVCGKESTEADSSPGGSDVGVEETAQRSWQDLLYMDEWQPVEAGLERLQYWWTQCMHSYMHLLEYEESYMALSTAQRELDENIVTRGVLDQFWAYMKKRPHWRLLIETLPKTPADLADIEKDDARRTEMWIKVQRFSGYRHALVKKLNNAELAIVNNTLKFFADDASTLHNFCLTLLSKRTSAIKARVTRDRTVDGIKGLLVTEDIERRSVKDLGVREFIENYAKKRKPVVITDLDLFKTPWTREHIASKCGSKRPKLVTKDFTAETWGGIVDVEETVNLTDFLKSFNTNATRRKWYLHDWSLPRNCPDIMGKPPFDEFRYPRYFAGDYFQRIPFVGYQHMWPSLFVGANGTESRMHVDSGGTGFWLYLLEGQKEWRFYDRLDKQNLYPHPGNAHYFFDPFRPDFTTHPLAATAKMYRTRQFPGELMFIPAGCPHGVQNFADIVGISMNLVDASNEHLYKWNQLMDESFRNYEIYASPSFPKGLRSNEKDLTMGEFKSQKWYSRKVQSELDVF